MDARPLSPRIPFVLVLLSLLGLLAPAGTASAQMGLSRRGLYEPQLGADELQRLAEELELSEDQQALVDALHQGYMSAFNEAADASRERMAAIRDEARQTRDWQTMADRINEARDAWDLQKKQLEEALLKDMRQVLTEEQMERWPRYEKNRRRRATLESMAQLSGEGVDLVELVRSLELPDAERSKLEATLSAYIEELDPPLIERNRAIEDRHDLVFDFNDPESIERSQRAAEVVSQRRVAVREVNFRFADLLAGQLEPPHRAALEQAFQRAAFPGIYADTLADHYLKRVLELDSLTDEQRRAVETIRGDYRLRVEDLNRRMAEAQRNEELKPLTFRFIPSQSQDGDGGGASFTFGVGEDGNGGERRPDPRVELRERKRELIESTLDAAFNALSPEQQAELPRPQIPEPLSPREKLLRERERGLPGPVREDGP